MVVNGPFNQFPFCGRIRDELSFLVFSRIFEFRKIIGDREKCKSLVPKDYPVYISKVLFPVLSSRVVDLIGFDAYLGLCLPDGGEQRLLYTWRVLHLSTWALCSWNSSFRSCQSQVDSATHPLPSVSLGSETVSQMACSLIDAADCQSVGKQTVLSGLFGVCAEIEKNVTSESWTRIMGILDFGFQVPVYSSQKVAEE